MEDYRGRAFSADRVALEFAAPRPEMPIHLAAMADRSLALCGRLADGLIVSNLAGLAKVGNPPTAADFQRDTEDRRRP
jgi:hypothetical protein